MILSDPIPDFFDPDSEMVYIENYIAAHTINDNIDFLIKRITDLEVMCIEIRDTIAVGCYKLNGSVVTVQRKMLLEHIASYGLSDNGEINKYLEQLQKRLNNYPIAAAEQFLNSFEKSYALKQNSPPPPLPKKIKPINYNGPCKEMLAVFAALKNEGLVKYSVSALKARIHCTDTKKNGVEVNLDEFPLIVWLGQYKDLACVINCLVDHGRIRPGRKFQDFEEHLENKDGVMIKNISQNYNKACTEDAKYENPKLTGLIKSVLS